jgi:hypothetical protein
MTVANTPMVPEEALLRWVCRRSSSATRSVEIGDVNQGDCPN